MADEPKVVYRYAGDPDDPDAPWFAGVPKRDLTERDVADLDPWQLANATAKRPDGAGPLYVKAGTKAAVEAGLEKAPPAPKTAARGAARRANAAPDRPDQPDRPTAQPMEPPAEAPAEPPTADGSGEE